MKRLTVIAPHPDDEVIGCGGTIRKLFQAGWGVEILVLTGTDATRQAEAQKAWATLFAEPSKTHRTFGGFCELPENRLEQHRESAIASVENAIRKADAILFPAADHHQDHRAANQITLAAARRFPGTIAEYSLPYNATFQPNCFVPLTSAQVATKIDAINCHASQLLRIAGMGDTGRSAADVALGFVEIQARMNGGFAGRAFAEAFRLVKAVIE